MEHLENMKDVFILSHPLIQHKISRLRDVNTGTNEFRKLIEEIAMLMGYEALGDLPTEEVEIEAPIETCMAPVISGKKMAIVPILRAGLGMVNGMLALVPSAKVGHIGLYRDPKTHEPHEYYCKLPEPIDQRTIVVLDPMLATGGSGSEAVNFIKKHGGRHIKFMCIIACRQLSVCHNGNPPGHIAVLVLYKARQRNRISVPGVILIFIPLKGILQMAGIRVGCGLQRIAARQKLHQLRSRKKCK